MTFSDLVHFVEDGTKLKTSSEIFPPLKTTMLMVTDTSPEMKWWRYGPTIKTSLKIFKHYKLKPSFSIFKDNKTKNGWWTLCTKTHFTPREHFTSQKHNTLCSPTHLAKSQFTLQHTLLLNTLCHSEPFCFLELFASQHILLPGTLCSSALFTP